MMPITEEVHAFLTANAAAQIQRDDEYLDSADGLLHCKTCHGLRQTVIPAPGGTGFLRPRCLCPCQSAAEKQRKAAEETAGAAITSFRFNLSDGTSYELIYACHGVKNGNLESSTGNFKYFTSADIGSYWDNIDLEAVSVEESELPKVN